MKKAFAFIVTWLCMLLVVFAKTNPDDIVGIWLDAQGKGQIHF